MKNALLLFIAILVFSCSPDDSPSPDVPDNDATEQPKEDVNSGVDIQTVTLNLEGITLNYDGLQVVSTDSESDLEENQDIDIPVEQEESGLPIVFTKNDEILFGYYPKEGDAIITNDDLLFFYFFTFPSIQVLEVEEQIINAVLDDSSNKNLLENEMVSSLNESMDPFENTSFTDIFVPLAEEIISVHRGQSSDKTTNEFDVYFEREGKVNWPNDVPLFATINIEIVEKETGQVVSQDFLEPKDMDLIGKVFDVIYNLSTYISGNNTEPSYQLVADGEYILRFTNGYPFNSANAAATEENMRLLFSQSVGLILSSNIWSKDAQGGCISSIKDKLINASYERFKSSILSINDPTEEATKEVLKLVLNDIAEDVADLLLNCADTAIFQLLLKSALKKITILLGALDTSSLLFATRDFLRSEIYEEQPMYYQNDILVGEVVEELISGIDFALQPNENFTYEASYKEKFISYNIIRDGLKPSTVESEVEELPLNLVTFKYEIFEGDVTSSEPISKKTDGEGKITFSFTMGNENSLIYIDPEFLSPNVETKTIIANVCGNNEIQNILNILEGKIWCYTQPAGPACSTGPWTISGNNRVVATGFTGTSWDYYYDFYMDEECNEILIRGTSGYNGSVIISRLLVINESTFSYELLSNPGTIITWVPQ